MSTRRSSLIFLAVLVAGIALGVVLAAVWDDGDDETEADDGPSSTTATESTTTPAAAPSTSSSTTTSVTSTTVTTTAAPTTTTSAPPGDAPLADATTGELLGWAMGTPMSTVEASLVARLGTPDQDTGWTTGCPLDGNTDLDERVTWWGELRVRFARVDDTEITGGWNYGSSRPGAVVPTAPPSDDIVMPSGVAWGDSASSVAAAIGSGAQPDDVFGRTWVYDTAFAGRWATPSTDPSQPFTEVAWLPADLCD